MKNRVQQVFDEYLIMQYRTNNPEALGLLVKRWHVRLVRTINYKLHDMELSKDIAQESWLAIIKGLPRLRDPSEFGVWALRIAHNKACDWLRKNRDIRVEELSHSKTLEIEDTDVVSKEEDMDIVLIRKSFQDMRPKDRHLLSMYYYNNYSVRQIGIILNISEGTVKSRLYNARKKLKNKMLNSKKSTI